MNSPELPPEPSIGIARLLSSLLASATEDNCERDNENFILRKEVSDLAAAFAELSVVPPNFKCEVLYNVLQCEFKSGRQAKAENERLRAALALIAAHITTDSE